MYKLAPAEITTIIRLVCFETHRCVDLPQKVKTVEKKIDLHGEKTSNDAIQPLTKIVLLFQNDFALY